MDFVVLREQTVDDGEVNTQSLVTLILLQYLAITVHCSSGKRNPRLGEKAKSI